MSALEDEFGDGGGGVFGAGIDFEDLHGEGVALAGHDVIEGDGLPAAGVGEGDIGECAAVVEEADFFDAAVFLECGVGLDVAVGDVEAVEGGVVEFLWKFFGEDEGEFRADYGVGPCGVLVVIVKGVNGGLGLAGEGGEGLPRESATERAAAHELGDDGMLDDGLDELRIGGGEPRERKAEKQDEAAHGPTLARNAEK